MSMIYREDSSRLREEEARSFESWIVIECKIRIFVRILEIFWKIPNIQIFRYINRIQISLEH